MFVAPPSGQKSIIYTTMFHTVQPLDYINDIDIGSYE